MEVGPKFYLAVMLEKGKFGQRYTQEDGHELQGRIRVRCAQAKECHEPPQTPEHLHYSPEKEPALWTP